MSHHAKPQTLNTSPLLEKTLFFFLQTPSIGQILRQKTAPPTRALNFWLAHDAPQLLIYPLCTHLHAQHWVSPMHAILQNGWIVQAPKGVLSDTPTECVTQNAIALMSHPFPT